MVTGRGLDIHVRTCLTKQAYASEAGAYDAARHYRQKKKPGSGQLRAYACPYATPDNPHWHLTSQPPRDYQTPDYRRTSPN